MFLVTTTKLACAAAATVLVTAGCGGSGQSSSAGGAAVPPATGGGSSASDFCTLDAKLVARKQHDLSAALGSETANQSQIVDDLLKDAPVTQSDLAAAAPAEPRRYLDALADPGNLDAVTDNMKGLNNWALKNCDAKYRPLFEWQDKFLLGG
ncbi:hypothetical protein EB75_00575 [Mycobacterium sp. ST-F2]|uniref:hypothetical protein n=1 Tax=Mycobacterium sp. ST-F2 TaxID=1490484 RepID=UPI0009390503|nr:hypothetical protein [Mycobacterium sp. ST-F2]OKH85093.1 hypothetical protein EB75_00575 [Mycobacterium sp. ST-F2]